ncbi:MAG: RQC domain-containing protein, partial [Pseudomonadota bacterium]|nr:RQC domain-containing protein [Pseudomonadota bacterium]
CDICENPPESFDGTLAAQKALSAIYRTGQRFGVAHTVNILIGKESEQTKRFGHDKLNVWGKGKEHGQKEWQSIFRQLHALGLISVDMDNYSALKLTAEGAAFIKEKQEIALRVEKSRKAIRSEEAASMIERMLTNENDQQIFDALRSKRAELAKAQNVPPYVIFHDKTLIHMAKVKPQTPSDLSLIPGIGASKLGRYGDAFLDVIAGVA